MLLFWASIILAIVIGCFTLFSVTAGIGTQFIALILAGNAYARLQCGKPLTTPVKAGAMWVAVAVSVISLAVGLIRAAS